MADPGARQGVDGLVMKSFRWRDWLIDPRVRAVDPDSPEATLAHRRVVESKPMLRRLYAEFAHRCREMDGRYVTAEGARLEIGSGASWLKQFDPQVISSDAKRLPFVDVVLDAQAMPLPDASLCAVYGINVFHHLPEPRDFLRELSRVLKPGGGLVLIEPYYGPVARRLYHRLHAFEGFDPAVASWEQPDTRGPAAGANQALSFVVFKRDRAAFAREFPDLELMVDQPHTHLLYLLSGGVHFRQLAPDGLTPLLVWAEQRLAPLNSWIALQHTIVLRKRRSSR